MRKTICSCSSLSFPLWSSLVPFRWDIFYFPIRVFCSPKRKIFGCMFFFWAGNCKQMMIWVVGLLRFHWLIPGSCRWAPWRGWCCAWWKSQRVPRGRGSTPLGITTTSGRSWRYWTFSPGEEDPPRNERARPVLQTLTFFFPSPFCRYIFLLDKLGRIRWQGFGLATEEELSSLFACTSHLLEEKWSRTGLPFFCSQIVGGGKNRLGLAVVVPFLDHYLICNCGDSQ